MSHRLPNLILGGVILLILGGLITYTLSASPLAPDAELTVCNGDEPETIDPALATGQLEGRIIFALFEGLTSLNAAGEPIPGQADKWEISPDQKTYTFHIRDGAQWSNHVPVTAFDFLKSWKRILEPSTGCLYNYQLFYVKNAEAYADSKITDFSQVGLEAPDAKTFIIHLEQPVAFFLEITAFTTLSPVYLPLVEAHPNDWTRPENFIGNGPYALKSWRLNNYIYLEASPSYWRPVNIRSIKLLPLDNSNSVFNLFYSNKLDLVMDKSSVPTSLISIIRKQPYCHPNPNGSTTFVRFNVKNKPFDDVRVRQALTLAMDRERIITKITRAGEAPAFTLVPTLPGYTPPEGLPYDVQRAQKLLADAGYPNGVGFPDVSLLYPARGSSPQVAEEIQSIWRANLGISSISIRGQEWKVYLDSQQKIQYDSMISSWVADYSDPKTFLDMFVKDGGNNNTNWSSVQYDTLLDQTGNTPDPAARMAIFSNMERILIDEGTPICPLYHQVGLALYHGDRLHGFVPNFIDDHRWTEMSITPAGQTPQN